MAKLAKWLTVATVVTLVLTAFLIVSAQLSATVTAVSIEPAADRPDAFESLAAAIERGDLDDNQYRQLFSDNVEDYAFVTYAVELTGFCPLPAEWAVVKLSPQSGDVALLNGAPVDVPPFGARTVTATLLTALDHAGDARSLWVEYYVFGRSMSAAAHDSAS